MTGTHPWLAGEERGANRFGLRAIERIIRQALADIPGIAFIDATLGGLRGRSFPRMMVQIDPTLRTVTVDLAIAVVWPSPVELVARTARDAVTETIFSFTGYTVARVNVNVGLCVPGQRISSGSVLDHRPTPATSPHTSPPAPLRPITITPLYFTGEGTSKHVL